MIRKKTCILVAAFEEGQIGFLDFSYRVKSLAAHYRLTIVSNVSLTQQVELQAPNVSYVVIKCGKGRLTWLYYLWCCGCLIRQQRPNLAVLLHSAVSPVAMLVGRVPSITYWNEHPTHTAPEPTGFSLVKTIVRAVIRWMMFQGARQSTLVMPIGEAHRDDLLTHGCKPDKTWMIYMGVEQSFSGVALSSLTKEDDAPLRLIYVGSVAKNRGRDVMLEAMAITNQGNNKIAHLTIVGANEEQSKHCRELVHRLGISDVVTIHGRVPGHKIPDYMREADAGLCLWEDQPWCRFNPPTKLFEYLVAGLPVLASNIPTHTQYLQNDFNGLIFEYGSTGLAEAIKHLWLTRDQLATMKLRARDSSAGYEWQTIEPLFLEACNGVAH